MVAVASHQQKCCQNQGLISEALDSGPCSSPRRGWVSSTGPPAHKWLVIKASWWQGTKTLKVYRLASAWAPTLSPHLSIFTTFEQGVIIQFYCLVGECVDCLTVPVFLITKQVVIPKCSLISRVDGCLTFWMQQAKKRSEPYFNQEGTPVFKTNSVVQVCMAQKPKRNT